MWEYEMGGFYLNFSAFRTYKTPHSKQIYSDIFYTYKRVSKAVSGCHEPLFTGRLLSSQLCDQRPEV